MGGKLPKNYEECLKELKKAKAEQVLFFVAGILIGALALMIYINH